MVTPVTNPMAILNGEGIPSGQEIKMFSYKNMNPLNFLSNELQEQLSTSDNLQKTIVTCLLDTMPTIHSKSELIRIAIDTWLIKANTKDYSRDAAAYVNKKDILGMTSLHTAVSLTCHDDGICQLLIDLGADVNAVNNYDYTALFMAVGSQAPLSIIELLLQHGANPNIIAKTDQGYLWSALQLAIATDKLDYVDILSKYGADVKMKVPYRQSGLINLAVNDEMRDMLYAICRKQDRKREKTSSHCAVCSCPATGTTSLKRCGRCYVTFYCSKEHQTEHWKTGHSKTCPGYISVGNRMRMKMGMDIAKKINYNQKRGKFDCPASVKEAWGAVQIRLAELKGKYFVYKAITSPGDAFMLFTNEDSTLQSWIYPEERGYFKICQMVGKKGGEVGYFWATPDDPLRGTVKVFISRFAPWQENW